ncbi:unnamed protein product [Rhodiola kirilowii]
MAIRLLNSALILLLVIATVHAQSELTDFIFQGFKGSSPAKMITLSNSSSITKGGGGALQLTNSTTRYQTGHAFYSQPFQMFSTNTTSLLRVESFSTTFVFQILPLDILNGGGHGIAFVIAPSSYLPDGAPGSNLGVFNPKTDGNFSNHILAIEFDTVKTVGDMDANHVGIDLNSIKSTTAVTATFYNSTNQKQTLKLESGKAIQAWIEYDGALKLITVTISPLSVPKPRKPLLSFNTDLSTILKRSMYVGFSSATGKLSSAHYILGWSFRIGGPSKPLDPKKLAFPPRTTSSGIKKKSITVGVGSSIFVIVLIALLASSYIYYLQVQKHKDDVLEDWELNFSHRFPYKELYMATKGFNKSEIIGSGGFGCVYRGLLPSTKQAVAIKKVTHNSRQGIREFVAEVESLGRMRHKHLVHLHGWCKRKDDLLLVYEFMPNGSLDDILFNDSKIGVLEWGTRFRVLKGIASALVYLHEEWEHVVVHRDVKASNVLLDTKMDGRLGDFGLARLYEHGNNPSTTHIVGTLGYMAPELARTNKATTCCDVYSFGALLLEMACGRRPVNSMASSDQILLVEWARDCWVEGNILKAADPKLENKYMVGEMELVLKLGLVCCQRGPQVRPTMRQVTCYLAGSESLDYVSPGILDIKGSSLGTGSSSTSSFSMGFISSDTITGGRFRETPL